MNIPNNVEQYSLLSGISTCQLEFDNAKNWPTAIFYVFWFSFHRFVFHQAEQMARQEGKVGGKVAKKKEIEVLVQSKGSFISNVLVWTNVSGYRHSLLQGNATDCYHQ